MSDGIVKPTARRGTDPEARAGRALHATFKRDLRWLGAYFAAHFARGPHDGESRDQLFERVGRRLYMLLLRVDSCETEIVRAAWLRRLSWVERRTSLSSARPMSRYDHEDVEEHLPAW